MLKYFKVTVCNVYKKVIKCSTGNRVSNLKIKWQINNNLAKQTSKLLWTLHASTSLKNHETDTIGGFPIDYQFGTVP